MKKCWLKTALLAAGSLIISLATKAVFFPGMAMAYSFYTNPDNKDEEPSHSVKFTLFEPTGHDGVLYFIGSEVIADFHNLGTSDWEFLGTAYLAGQTHYKKSHGFFCSGSTKYALNSAKT
ncbi:MAG: hypothetical protein IJ727_10705 [Treponema sp.]|nr:hypothetical protein [Treponema sp.]